MVVPKHRSTKSLTSETTRMPQPNRSIEVRWLPADLIDDEYENNLRRR